jgi:FK506-binding protein 1
MSKYDVQIEITVAGDGYTYPKPGDLVTIEYTGKLLNGNEFDSTIKRGKPFQFKIGQYQVISGLDYTISQISLGEKVIATIPSYAGFGDKGIPGLIPPKSTIIFDVQLLSIQ